MSWFLIGDQNLEKYWLVDHSVEISTNSLVTWSQWALTFLCKFYFLHGRQLIFLDQVHWFVHIDDNELLNFFPKGYGVIGVNVFHRKLLRFHRKY